MCASFTDPENLLNGNAMNGSSRATALNIVADMLRKLNVSKAPKLSSNPSIFMQSSLIIGQLIPSMFVFHFCVSF